MALSVGQFNILKNGAGCIVLIGRKSAMKNGECAFQIAEKFQEDKEKWLDFIVTKTNRRCFNLVSLNGLAK